MTPRTLLITERYLPEVGGSFVWFDETYRRFPPGTVTILTRAHPGGREHDRTRSAGMRTVRVALRRYAFLRPESLALLAKLVVVGTWLVWRRSIDVIHAGKGHPEGFAARLISKLTRVPYLVYAHGEELTVVLADRNYDRHRERFRATYEDAAAVIANSEYTAKELIGFGVSPERIVCINPGVDPSVFTPGPADPDLRRRHGLEGKLVLLSVGRLQKRKGHDRVLDALPKVLARQPDLVYVILSGGVEEQALRGRARELGIEGNVRFVGEVPFGELPEWYRACDIFIMANRAMPDGDVEGFGIVFLEAAACGKPVIAGRSGGTGDAVRDGTTGLRVDASDPDRIAEAILELAGNPALRSDLGGSGRVLAESEYSWATVSRKIALLSESVAAGAPPPRLHPDVEAGPGSSPALGRGDPPPSIGPRRT